MVARLKHQVFQKASVETVEVDDEDDDSDDDDEIDVNGTIRIFD